MFIWVITGEVNLAYCSRGVYNGVQIYTSVGQAARARECSCWARIINYAGRGRVNIVSIRLGEYYGGCLRSATVRGDSRLRYYRGQLRVIIRI